MPNTALAVVRPAEPLDILSSSSPSDREARGRALAEKFKTGVGEVVVKFIGELKTEITAVRQDFFLKPKNELICGVSTFTKYCEAVLGYTIRHIDRILEGHNPTLTDDENATARQCKEKRELTARVNRNQKALPIRKKTNAEVLAEAQAEQGEANKVDVLQKHVASLKRELEVATATKPALSAGQEKDLTKIHAGEVKALETEIKKSKGSIENLAAAYETLRRDAVALATAIRKPKKVPAEITARAAEFLDEYGEKDAQGK